MRHLISLVLLSVYTLCQCCPSATISPTYSQTPTARNPFRGFMSYDQASNPPSTTFPTSLEYQYVKMSDVNPADGVYNWTAVDQLASAAVSRGNHLIYRVYIDYPSLPSALPTYLTQGRHSIESHTIMKIYVHNHIHSVLSRIHRLQN